jgi:hypothetical protein
VPRLLARVAVVVLITVIMDLGVSPVAGASASNHQYVVDELAKPEYAGRQAGTPGFAKAVTYVSQQMRDVGMQPALNGSDFQLPYTASTAVLTNESVSLAGHKLARGVDYQPFARTPSGTFSTTSAFYAGNSASSDYLGTVNGAVIFHWNKLDGNFGDGILDRIQIAQAHGAKAVVVIADGELLASNFEHLLNARTIEIPAIYISKAAAIAAGIPVDHKAKALPPLSLSIALSILRDTNAAATDLLGVIPGKREDHAILWLTNIDSFGQLPDGRSFAGAVSGSAAAAMMLDLAQRYQSSPPEFTQLFAFVGSKWNDQAGVQALAKRLNWSHIDATFDLYAMGGTGEASRLNVGYTDPAFANSAKSISSTAYFNNALGNGLSSQLLGLTKHSMLVRDLDTWIDDSISDIPSRITAAAYSTGIDSLLGLGSAAMKVLAPTEDVVAQLPSFSPVALGSANLPVMQTDTPQFTVDVSAIDQLKMTVPVLNSMQRIYNVDSFYNYDPVPPTKATALFISDDKTAAEVCKRSDLVTNPSAAGGGFASTDNGMCIYQSRSGNGSEPIWYGNIAHELNHAMANAQSFYPRQSDLQEWQGQSQIVIYNNATGEPLSSAPNIITGIANFEVPNLQSLISDYKTKIDWSWFTSATTNPLGWQYTYHLAGSMYAFLADQYGVHASRRAMYRNYEDVKKFQENMIADTGLTFDQFGSQWSHWMLNEGQPLTPVAATVKAQTDQNNAFDYMLVYTHPNSSTTAAISNSNVSPGSVPAGTRAATTVGTLTIDLAGTSGSDIQQMKANVYRSGANYEFVFVFTSAKVRQLGVFIPPDSILGSAAIAQGKNVITVEFPQGAVAGAALLMLNFYISDADRAFVPIDASSLVVVPLLDKATANKIAADKAALLKSAKDKAAADILGPGKAVAAKKKSSITCVKGKASKKVIAVNPKCPSGFKVKK